MSTARIVLSFKRTDKFNKVLAVYDSDDKDEKKRKFYLVDEDSEHGITQGFGTAINFNSIEDTKKFEEALKKQPPDIQATLDVIKFIPPDSTGSVIPVANFLKEYKTKLSEVSNNNSKDESRDKEPKKDKLSLFHLHLPNFHHHRRPSSEQGGSPHNLKSKRV